MGDAPAPITLPDVRTAYEMFGFNEWLTAAEFVDYMFGLDRAFIEWHKDHNPSRAHG